MNAHTPHARVPVGIARNAAVSPQARCLYLILATYAGPDGRCWPSRRTLAADLGLSIRTVATLLGELERSGLLRRHCRRGASTVFHLLCPSVAEPEPQVAVRTGADEPGLVPTADAASPAAPPLNPGNEKRQESVVPPPFLASTRAADCTPPEQIPSLSLIPGGATRATDCMGAGNRLHGDVQPVSHRTNPKNYPTQPIADTEALAAPPDRRTHPLPDSPGIADPWSTRFRFDPADRWPDYEQVRAYALRSGVPEPDAVSIWESFTAVGWVDRHGNPIRHWGAALSAAWRFREENRNRQSRSAAGIPDAITHTTHRSHEHPGTRSAGSYPATAEGEDPRITEALAMLKARRRQRQAEHGTAH